MTSIRNCSIVHAIILIALFAFHTPGHADSAGDLYFEAESCYSILKKNNKKQQYRSNWIACIQKFQDVYKHNPGGKWAPAGLYMTGFMFHELYKRSGNVSDRNEARDHFQRIMKRFPNSAYNHKATSQIAALKQTHQKKNGPAGKPKKSHAEMARDKYYRAEKAYQDLQKNPKKQKLRHHWLSCIGRYRSAYVQEPGGKWAPASLFMVGKLYQELSHHSYNASDLDEAVKRYKRVITKFPGSQYRKKAESELIALNIDFKKETAGGKGDPKNNKEPGDQGKDKSLAQYIDTHETGKAKPERKKNGRVMVTDLRTWSNPNYTRIAIYTDRETTFQDHLLKRDPTIKKPQRLYVDLYNAKLGPDIKKIISIDDDLLSHARAGQYTKSTVRVVADIKSFDTHKVIALKDPFRIIMDIRGKEEKPKKTIVKKKKPKKKKINKIDPNKLSKDIVQQLGLGVKRIIVDPGHGGKDFGAPGYFKGVHEKNVVLQIGRRLTRKLRKELKCEVIMTRSNDKYLTLEERTAMANVKKADLFISIHTNANRKKSIYGIETYFLNPASNYESKRVAARENATSTKNISDLDLILRNLMQTTKINESSRLASYIQNSMCNHLKKKGYSRIKNKGVPSAPFYVLMGADMPAVLVETSFISNKRECKRLLNKKYQERLCEGIVLGVKKYIRENKSAAFRQAPQINRKNG